MPDSALGPSARQAEILRIVAEEGYSTLDTLAQRLSVSVQSVRRDVITLDHMQLLQRFRGGAAPAAEAGSVRLGHAEKAGRAAAAKEAIARRAAEMIPAGATIFLDVGTSIEALARALRSRDDRLQVFTNSLASALLLSGETNIQLHVLGGTVAGADGSMVGASVLAAVARMRFDLAFLACSGFDEDGAPMDYDLEKIAVKEAAAGRADATILLADASKFARRAIGRVLPPAGIETLVTEAAPPPHQSRAFEVAGTEVVIAPGTR